MFSSYVKKDNENDIKNKYGLIVKKKRNDCHGLLAAPRSKDAASATPAFDKTLAYFHAGRANLMLASSADEYITKHAVD